jgi:chromosome segregation ATPase
LSKADVGQTQNQDSQILKQILAELRAIHEDMRVTETTQLLVAEIEMQQGVLNRATENVDNARTKLNGILADQKRLASELDRAEEALDKAGNADDRNGIAQTIDQFKSTLAAPKKRPSAMQTQISRIRSNACRLHKTNLQVSSLN